MSTIVIEGMDEVVSSLEALSKNILIKRGNFYGKVLGILEKML